MGFTVVLAIAVLLPAYVSAAESSDGTAEIEHVILFVLEGIGPDAVKAGPMPTLGRFVKEGAATWSASTVQPPLRLPAMASLLTGLPVEKHGITWNNFEFVRGYPRPPTVFDYLDLSGGKDSAVFFMDESLYQLAKPEPYTDYQMCGPLKPECTPDRLVQYIKDYFRKATSGHGYGHAILALPHFLVVHLPEPGRAGEASGWKSRPYREALRTVDSAMRAVLQIYKDLHLIGHTTVIVTSLNGEAVPLSNGQNGSHETSSGKSIPSSHSVPWIAWGAGIKPGYIIKQSISIIDTGATVMRLLGLETYTEWESHPVEEIFRGPIPVRPKSP
ncbi:MAG: alkaline phosphatase family protein [Actinobacteria bacterium]|nr:alkaline phosphatase family protein [Actinomycetota bacterium]